MYRYSSNNQRGLIKFVILIIIGILVLSYFSIDIRSIVESEQSQSNFQYVWGWVVFVWAEYLGEPVRYFWDEIFLKLIWSSFVENMEKIKRGEPNDLESGAPQGAQPQY
ncbi:MAG: hypothetical protein HY455_02655 [Parcubacteria group bacterium]|nr:hypothetical protein [Parcubacteria group bacterium]